MARWLGPRPRDPLAAPKRPSGRPGTRQRTEASGGTPLRALLERFRPIGHRVVLTATDQGVASLSNFAVGIAIARIAGIAALGAYSLAYVVWLAGADFHRSLVVEPMAIENDAWDQDANERITTGLASELVLGVVIGCAIAAAGAAFLVAGQRDYGVAFLAVAPWIPCLLVQDYWRWVAFMKAAPGRALANDAVFDVFEGVGFALLLLGGVHSSVLAIDAWGVGALAGAVLGLRQHSVVPTFRDGLAGVRRRWRMSKWLFGASIAHWCSSQAYLLFTGLLLGPVAIGGLKAAQGIVNGPSLVLFQLGGNIGLPEASRALHARGWTGLRRVERTLTMAAVLCVAVVVVVVFLFGRELLVDVYGPQFGRFASTADVLSVSVLLSAVQFGAVLSLKATKLTGTIFKNSALMLVVSVVAAGVLVPLFGVLGAACAVAVRTGMTSSTTLWLHWRHSQHEADRLFGARTGAVGEATPRAPAGGGDHELAPSSHADGTTARDRGEGRTTSTSSIAIW